MIGMNVASILLGAVLVFVVITTIYDDIRRGLIRNVRLLQGLGAGTVAYALIIALGYFRWDGSGPAALLAVEARGISWFLGILLNTVSGLVAGIILWHFKVWAAGDAKLFTLYCYLIPTDLYRASDVPVFPGIILLINVFTFTFIFLCADAVSGAVSKLRRLAGSGRMSSWRERLAGLPGLLAKWVPLILAFTAMFAGIRAMREAARESIAPLFHFSEFTLFMLLFIAFKPISELVKKRAGAVIFSLASAAALAYLAWRHGMNSLVHLVRPGGFAVLLLVFARIYQNVGNVKKVIGIGQLRPGMILAPETLASLVAIEEREKQEAMARGEGEPEEPDDDAAGVHAVPKTLGTVLVDGLSAEQIRFIRTRFKDDEKIMVAQTVSFSPLLAMGALATFFTGRIFIRMFLHAITGN
jgi:hypothetical protein